MALANWKKSYDQPRQHIKIQRHYFANIGPSSQSCGFFSSHIWMWELDYKESWAPKNWCFWTVVLEKTPESPLDCKKIQPAHPNTFSKTSLNIWKFTVHVLLKPGLENFEHYFTSMWDECNCVVVWAFFGIAFFVIGRKTALFQSCGHCWVFQICWYIECTTFTASSFKIWNISTGFPSPPLALLVVMLPKAHLTSYFQMSGSK